jgi:hypothetical protein
MITFVTACNQRYFNNWLFVYNNIHKLYPEADIYFFDLGCDDPEYIKKLDKVNYFYFDFSEYPDWFNVNNKSRGEWAWKSICIQRIRNLLIKSGKSDTVLFWSDSCNNFNEVNKNMEKYCRIHGLFSNTSSGSVQRWTVPKTIEALDGYKYIDYPMRNAAYMGFYIKLGWVNEFIDELVISCLNKDVIAPEGSDRSNHRQDQSVMTLLYYKYSEIYGFNINIVNAGVTYHNDYPK